MPFAPGIGDIALVVQTAYKVYSNFAGAPAEFRAIARETWSIHETLKDIDTQCKDRWSPLLRDSQRAGVLKTHLHDAQAELQALQAALDRYNSLGSAAPKLGERARYITENFNPVRDELRQRRAELDSLIELSNTSALGFILRRISDIFEEEQRGARRSVISGSQDDEEDVLSILGQDLQAQQFSQQDIVAHQADIQAYINDLRHEARFDQGPGWEITPKESASQLGSPMEELSIRPSSSQTKPVLGSSIAQFQGMPIDQRSFETIFNPHINFRGFRKTDTFDVWRLAEKSWAMQKKITDGIPVPGESDQQALSALQRELALFDPFLILILADSSTDRDFWRRMAGIRDADAFRSSSVAMSSYSAGHDFSTWPFHLPFDRLGQTMLSLLSSIDTELERCGRDANKGIPVVLQHGTSAKRQQQQSLAPPEESRWRSKFSKSLKRAKSSDTDTRTSSTTSASQTSPDGWTSEPGLPPLSHEGRTSSGAISWATYVRRLAEAIIGTISGSKRINANIFERALHAIEQRWNADYQRKVRPSDTENTGEEASPLLVQWLLSIQGLTAPDMFGVSNMSAELSFDSEPSRPLESGSTPSILPYGVFVVQTESWYGDRYIDLRVPGARFLSDDAIGFLSIRDQAIYALTMSIAITKYFYSADRLLGSRGNQRKFPIAIPQGYEELKTQKNVTYFVNTTTQTGSWTHFHLAK